MKPGFIILVLIGLILAWAVLSSTGNSLSSILQGRDSGTDDASTETEDRPLSASETIIINPDTSSFAEQITLRKARATDDNPREEYLEIRSDKDNVVPVNITGWNLKSTVSGHRVTVGNVAKLPVWPGNHLQNNNVVLEPGDKAYIISGPSPVKISFRTNLCTGYFAENKDFHPRLSRDCPDAEDEDLEKYGLDSDPPNNSRDEECLREIKRVGKCENPPGADSELSRSCEEFIDQIDYNWCAALHLTDDDFVGDEWYVYIKSAFNDIWHDDDDNIELRDTTGRLVDVLSY